MNELAPIVLFVYNRPWHTEQTLIHLALNDLSSESTLYIFADGAKPNSSQEQLKDITEVRKIIRAKKWCKEVVILESQTNKGLANSIIDGVTQIVNLYGKIIVLEDDIVTSRGFLSFMNDALNLYREDVKVAGVTGFSYVESKDDSFFFYDGSSWSWGTWKRVWEQSNFDGEYWLTKLNNKKLIKRFNLNGFYNYHQMLQDQIQGVNDSWAIRFYCSYFFQQQLFLYPQRSMVMNIGFDIGTHCFGGERNNLDEYPFLLHSIALKRVATEEKKDNTKLIFNYFKVAFGSIFYNELRKKRIKLIKWIKRSFLIYQP